MNAALEGKVVITPGEQRQGQRSGNPIRTFLERAYGAPILPATAKKPSSLIYNADDRPNIVIALSNGVQHVGLISINLVYPLLICRAVDAPISLVENLLSVGMIVLSIGTLIQVLRLGPVGSGYMLPSTFTASYFAPGLIAARIGGLPLVFGMTIFAGALEALVAPMLNRLRKFLPVEVSGLVIFMLGVAAGLAGLRTLLGPAATPVEFGRVAGRGYDTREHDRAERLGQRSGAHVVRVDRNHYRLRCRRGGWFIEPRTVGNRRAGRLAREFPTSITSAGRSTPRSPRHSRSPVLLQQ